MLNVKRLIERVKKGGNAVTMLNAVLNEAYGDTQGENEHIRYIVNNSQGHVTVYELEHAGKRGSNKVRMFTLFCSNMLTVNKTMYQNWHKFVRGLPRLNFDQAAKCAQMIANDSVLRKKSKGNEKDNLMYFQLSDIDAKKIAPSGHGDKIELKGKDYWLKATYANIEFGAAPGERFSEYSTGGAIKTAKLFMYIKQNKAHLETMGIGEIRNLFNKFGVGTKTYFYDHD